MWLNNTVETLELSAPVFLLAMPQLAGGPFAQAVLLLVQHDGKGSMGLVVNKPSGVTVDTFGSSLGVTFSQRGQQEVHVGGPVEGERAFILHGGPHRGPETAPVMPGVAMSFSMESLTALATKTPEDLRICVGYAGWGTEQLAVEIARGSWMVGQADGRFLFDTPPERMWQAAFQSMGIEPLQLMQRPTAQN